MATALENAIEAFGGSRRLAEALDVVPMTVSQWKRRGVPAERAVEIERATGGKVTRYDLRPDLFGRRKRAEALV